MIKTNSTLEFKENEDPKQKLRSFAIPTYVQRITEALGELTKQWLRISNILYDAKEYLDKKEYKELKAEIDLDESTINKLIKVAQSEFISNNMEVFSSTKSWVVLYQIALLEKDNQIKALDLAKKGSVSLKDIRELQGKVTSPSSNFGSPFIQLRVDTNTISDPHILETIEKDVGEFINDLNSDEVSIVMVSNSLQEKVEARLDRNHKSDFLKMEKETLKEIKQVLMAFYKSELAYFPPKFKHPKKLSKADQFTKKFGIAKEEIFYDKQSLCYAASFLSLDAELSAEGRSLCKQNENLT